MSRSSGSNSSLWRGLAGSAESSNTPWANASRLGGRLPKGARPPPHVDEKRLPSLDLGSDSFDR